jgi:hypothetical protein
LNICITPIVADRPSAFYADVAAHRANSFAIFVMGQPHAKNKYKMALKRKGQWIVNGW